MFKEYFVKRETHCCHFFFASLTLPAWQLKVLFKDKVELAWNIYMQCLHLIGTVPTCVHFRCAALQQSARGYNAQTYSQSKADVSAQSVHKLTF